MHFAAGPWFTVQNGKQNFEKLDRIWVSNGRENHVVDVQYKIRMLNPKERS